MALSYFDTSALVKYYVTEPGSTWVRQLIEEREAETRHFRHIILVAEITRVEVAAGLAVIERVGRIRRSERDREYAHFIAQLVHRYTIIPLTTTDLETAAALTQRHPLKAYDAVQLAVALHYHKILVLILLSLSAAIPPSLPPPKLKGFLPPILLTMLYPKTRSTPYAFRFLSPALCLSSPSAPHVVGRAPRAMLFRRVLRALLRYLACEVSVDSLRFFQRNSPPCAPPKI